MSKLRRYPGFSTKQSTREALRDDVFHDGRFIGHVKGPFQRRRGGSFYEWKHARGTFGESKSRRWATARLIATHKRIASRAYGSAARSRSAEGARVIYRGGFGARVWRLASGGYVMWSPGGRLHFSLASPLVAGSPYPPPIEHPSADGNYRTEREATAALRRFMAAGS